MYLLALDSTGTQPYIFGSNSLRHNIGASHLVARATGQWALEALVEVVSQERTNIKDVANLLLQDTDDPAYHIEKNEDLAAEVFYVGGGNVVVLFREKREADRFQRLLSRRLIARAPELKVVPAGRPFDWLPPEEKDALSISPLVESLDTVMRALGRKKAARRAPSRPVGRGVTQQGQIHGQPASAYQPPPRSHDQNEDAEPSEESDGDPYPISAEAKAKEDHVRDANLRLAKLLPLPSGYAYPYMLDNLGRAKGEQSFIAVVHADGDRMGNLLQSVARQNASDGDDPDRAFIDRIRSFSTEVREAALGAMDDVVTGLHAFIDKHPDGSDEVELPGVKAPLELKRRGDLLLLPLRPVVFGGDDVTFVCDGRLGLALAARYVRRFERRFEARVEKSDLLRTLRQATASAGVAIVKTHYPFSRAYDLAAELTRSAKDRRPKNGQIGADMDWHIALDDIAGSLDTVRRPYHLPSQIGPPARARRTLTVRPVAVTGEKGDAVDHWETIRARVREVRKSGHARSKVKMLREKLPQGPDAVRAFVREQGMENLFPDGPDGYYANRYYANRTPYLDVLELTDFAVLDDDLEACSETDPDTAD